MDTSPGPSPPPAAVLTAWPRSAQLTTAFLLGVCLTLLSLQLLDRTRWSSRPADLERGSAVLYRIDLNRAPRAELLQIPGVGPSLVEKIEQHRRDRGGFHSVEELTEVPGIGPARLAQLRPWLCVRAMASEPGPSAPPPEPPAPTPVQHSKSTSKKGGNLADPLDLNRATQAELQRLPGIGSKRAQAILEERERAPFQSVDDLRRVSGIGPKTLEKLRPYVQIGQTARSIVAAE